MKKKLFVNLRWKVLACAVSTMLLGTLGCGAETTQNQETTKCADESVDVIEKQLETMEETDETDETAMGETAVEETTTPETVSGGVDIGFLEGVNDYENDKETGLEIFSDTSYGDLDGNGIEERMIVREATEEGFDSHVAFYFNGTRIFDYDDVLMVSPCEDSGVLEDFDGDGEKEVFITFFPHVNSMPLIEYAVFKQEGGNWKQLELIHGEDALDNGFPISVIYHADGQFEIRCEGYEKNLFFDAKTYYEKQLASDLGNMNSAQQILDGTKYQEGDLCGSVAAWGVWEAYVDVFEGQHCIVAEHGITGENGKYDIYGTVFVYFRYDENGKVRIVSMDFKESE